MRAFQKYRGFSLTELLVVIVSIMILTGITLASLSRAKEFERVTTCLSNLHRLSQAAITYSVQDNGAFPSDYNTPGGYWYPQISRYDSGIAANALCPDALPPSGGIGTASSAWGIVNMNTIPHPPGYPWAVGTTSSYGLNNFVNPGDSIAGISSLGSATIQGNQVFRGRYFAAISLPPPALPPVVMSVSMAIWKPAVILRPMETYISVAGRWPICPSSSHRMLPRCSSKYNPLITRPA